MVDFRRIAPHRDPFRSPLFGAGPTARLLIAHAEPSLLLLWNIDVHRYVH